MGKDSEMNKPVAWIDKDTLDATHIIKAVVRREQDEQHNIPLYTHPVKEQDAIRYQWLRNEFAHGRETYLAEGMPSGESLDKYIDEQLKKAQEK